MASSSGRRIASGAPFGFVKPVFHDRCVLKRTRNGFRIKLARFSEVGKFVEQSEVKRNEVGRRQRKVLMSTLDIRAVRFDVNVKFRHARFIRSLDELLASALTRGLATDNERANRADRRTSKCSGSGCDRDKGGCFHTKGRVTDGFRDDDGARAGLSMLREEIAANSDWRSVVRQRAREIEEFRRREITVPPWALPLLKDGEVIRTVEADFSAARSRTSRQESSLRDWDCWLGTTPASDPELLRMQQSIRSKMRRRALVRCVVPLVVGIALGAAAVVGAYR
ncbi:hypothetical protein C6T58_05540 [Burkholderia multivorans]|nr:hypothetical protein C6T58_05540 [Burkholderia multivorans]